MRTRLKNILPCGRWGVCDLQLDDVDKTFETSKRARSYAKGLSLRNPNHDIFLTAIKSFEFNGEYICYVKKEWVVTMKGGKVVFKSNGLYHS